MALTGYEKYKVEDNAQGQLNTSITSGVTSITLKTGEGALFPASGDFLCTIIQFDGTGAFEEVNVVKREKVKVTARTTDVLTVVRGFDGSSATGFNADDYIVLPFTASLFEDVQDAISELDTNKLDDGDLRTGLTPWRQTSIDGSGDEVETGLGTAGQVWASNGAAAAPTFQTLGIDINALTADESNFASADKIAWLKDGDSTVYKRKAEATTTHDGMLTIATDADVLGGAIENEAITPSGLSSTYEVLAGTVTGPSADTERNTNATVAIIQKEFEVVRAGTYTTSYDMRNGNGGASSIGVLYIDGVATTLNSAISASATYITYTGDITVTAGQTVELWGRTTNATIGREFYCRNFRMNYQISPKLASDALATVTTD